MKLSVAICTWNRAHLLGETLESVQAASQRIRCSVEVIVVNNNSTDETDAVIDCYARQMPLRRVFEPQPGVAHARNAAIEAAVGDYLVWTDDDVLVDASWLAAYEAAFREHPHAGVFGGPIFPLFEQPLPPWLARNWRSVGIAFGLRDFGPEPLRLCPDRLPFGANFAVRMGEQKSIRFRTHLGRRPGDRWCLGEETEMLARLLAADVEGRWVPGASINHRIPVEHLTTTYLRRYHWGCGRSEVMLWELHSGAPVGLCRLGRLAAAWIKRELRYKRLLATGRSDLWVPALADASLAWGRLCGAGRRLFHRTGSC